MKYRTTLTAKAEIIAPNSDNFKAIATSLKDRYGFDLKPQIDLLYVRSCLVSAGTSIGINDNDDIFTREEAWAARYTPVLKPVNWQHKDKDIVGVMYSVQAKDVNGNILDINSDSPPNCDFDLWVEAAIFSLIHPGRADDINNRANANKLYVSMEAWFDDYSYGFCNQNGHLDKVVARNQNTSFLDSNLRASGGAGLYRDPELNQDVRIGRVLKTITFGGVGFVDRPANKRSVTDCVKQMDTFANQNMDLQIQSLLNKVLESNEEVELMNAQASVNKTDDIVAAVDSVIEKREKAAAELRERQQLHDKVKAAELRTQELETQINDLNKIKIDKETEVNALQTQLNVYTNVVNELVKNQVDAGATESTPPEIAAVDNATDGESAFKAKVAWINQSIARLRERATRAQELETQLAEAESVVREQEVRNLLNGHFSEEAIEVMVTRAASLDDEAYQMWRDEKELMVLEMTNAAEKKEMPPELKKRMKMKDEKETKANIFESLLLKRRSESGTANPDTMRNQTSLINHPGDGSTDVKSGVNPGSIRTPRHKIAGSAGDNPSQLLDTATVVDGISLAGSQAGEEVNGANPFRVIANMVVGTSRKEESASGDADNE